MADIFRVEKNQNYTVMSNHHFQNKKLSLRAKGLLSLMLSLPESWDYSLQGLVKICTEGKDAITKALKELETEGYLSRRQLHAAHGRFAKTEYIIREMPIPPCAENPDTVESQQESGVPESADTPVPPPDLPCAENPDTVAPQPDSPCPEKPHTVKPLTEKPCPVNPPQLSTYINKVLNEENTYQSIYPMDEGKIDEILREQIEFDILIQDPDYFGSSTGLGLLESILEIMKQPFISAKPTQRIGKEELPTTVVRSRLQKLDSDHIKYVYDCVFDNTKAQKIKNIQGYVLTALYNAPVSYMPAIMAN